MFVKFHASHRDRFYLDLYASRMTSYWLIFVIMTIFNINFCGQDWPLNFFTDHAITDAFTHMSVPTLSDYETAFCSPMALTVLEKF
jgi:hypothetical protein